MELLEKIAPHVGDIKAYLLEANLKEIVPNPNSEEFRRLELEQSKLDYLHRYPMRRDALLRAERIPCVEGQVGFLLEIEADDNYFRRIVTLTENNIKPNWDWGAKYLWPAIIALLAPPYSTSQIRISLTICKVLVSNGDYKIYSTDLTLRQLYGNY